MIVNPSYRVAPTPASAERLNAKEWARPFVARLLEPGLCSYEDTGCGKVLLRKETIDRCIRSFIGRPIVVKQKGRVKRQLGRAAFDHAKTSPANMKEIGHGYVTDVFYNESDGWWYGRGVVDTDEAAEAIKEVGKCSCAYGVKAIGPGGEWHDIPYEEEVLEFSGEHVAVVDAPRYEEATIRLNSKTNAGKTMSLIKWVKKLAGTSGGDDAAAQAAAAKTAADKTAAADAATRENAKATGEDISEETTFTIPGSDGKPATVSLGDLIKSHSQVGELRVVIENAKKNGVEVDGDDEIMCNGKKYKMNALVEAFDKWSKTNATDADKEKAAKENAKREEDEQASTAAQLEKDQAEKKKLQDAENAKGGKHFNVLLNARETAAVEPASASTLNTLDERLARGRSLYGSKKK